MAVSTSTKNQNQKAAPGASAATAGPAPIPMPSFRETSTSSMGAFHYDQELVKAQDGSTNAIVAVSKYWAGRANTAESRLRQQNQNREIPAIWKVKARLVSALCGRLSAVSHSFTSADSERNYTPFVRHDILRKPHFEMFSTADIIDLLNGLPAANSPTGKFVSGMRTLSSITVGYSTLAVDEDGWLISVTTKEGVQVLRVAAREAHKLLLQGANYQNIPFSGNGVMWTTGAVPNCDGCTLTIEDAKVADTTGVVHSLGGTIRISMNSLAYTVLVRAVATALNIFTFASEDETIRHQLYNSITELCFSSPKHLPKNASEVDYWQALYVWNKSPESGRDHLFDAGRMLHGYRPEDLADLESYQKARLQNIARRRGARAVTQKAQPQPKANPAFRASVEARPKVAPVTDYADTDPDFDDAGF